MCLSVLSYKRGPARVPSCHPRMPKAAWIVRVATLVLFFQMENLEQLGRITGDFADPSAYALLILRPAHVSGCVPNGA